MTSQPDSLSKAWPPRPGTVQAALSPGTPVHLNRRAIAAILFLILLLLTWQIYSSIVPSYLFPAPWNVAKRAILMWSDPLAVDQARLTLIHVFSAVTIAFVLGTGLSLLAHFVPVLRLATYGRLTPFLNSFSGIGWAFLGILWFGLDSITVVFAVSAVLLPFAIINAGMGLQELNRELAEMGCSFTRRVDRRIFHVILPLLFPYLFATMRSCLSMAWKVTLTAELFAGSGGLGTLINIARQRFDTEMIFSVILLLIVVVYGLDRFILEPIQKRLRKNYSV